MNTSLRLKNLEARRFGSESQPANINNNSTVTSLSAAGDTLTVSFIFTSNYEPNIGLIRIEGDLELSQGDLEPEAVVTQWEQSSRKQLPTHVAERIHNSILSTCMVQATVLSRDIQLPAPIPTPRVAIRNDPANATDDTQTYIR